MAGLEIPEDLDFTKLDQKRMLKKTNKNTTHIINSYLNYFFVSLLFKKKNRKSDHA